MQTCPHENGDGEWQDCPYVLWKNARKGLILCNTGFIITWPTVCLCVDRRQVIEEFINQLMVFRRGFCAGRVSGRRLCPKTEVLEVVIHEHIAKEGDMVCFKPSLNKSRNTFLSRLSLNITFRSLPRHVT